MDADKKIMDDLSLQEQTESNVEDMTGQSIEALLHGLTKNDHRQMMVEFYNNCSICGAELDFVHVTQFVALRVEEEGHCPSCNIRTKQNTHTLQ